MDEERLQPHSDFLPNQSGKGVDNGGDDRLSALPNEILLMILSLLPVRRAASSTLLSSRWLDLWKQIPNLKFDLESDRISQLPDQIISVILSFLPLKKAAATCVLSSRWSDSWKHTPNLNFDSDIILSFPPENSRCKRIELVNSILESHKALSLKQFRICFYVNKSSKWAVTKWLEFVFLRKVESLELEFLCSEDSEKVVLGESLREISMICGDLRTLIFFQSLKSLRLVSLEVSGEDIELFLHNCPLLEQLIIRCVSLTSDIEVCGPSLKCLEIFRCSGGKSFKVCAPNLSFIRFEDTSGKLLLGNVPRLVEAAFITTKCEFVMHHFASAASCHISQLQKLTIICLTHHKPFWTNGFPHMPNLKKLKIASFEASYQSLLQVTRLIWASPRLEKFKLQYFPAREASTANMQGMENVGRSPHQHLKAFHFHLPDGETVNDHVVDLVTYVSNNCIALRRVDIVAPGDPAPRLLQSQLPNHVQLSIRPR